MQLAGSARAGLLQEVVTRVIRSHGIFGLATRGLYPVVEDVGTLGDLTSELLSVKQQPKTGEFQQPTIFLLMLRSSNLNLRLASPIGCQQKETTYPHSTSSTAQPSWLRFRTVPDSCTCGPFVSECACIYLFQGWLCHRNDRCGLLITILKFASSSLELTNHGHVRQIQTVEIQVLQDRLNRCRIYFSGCLSSW